MKYSRPLRRRIISCIVVTAWLTAAIAWSQDGADVIDSAVAGPATAADDNAGIDSDDAGTDSAADVLDRFVAEVTDLQATFEESTYESDGRLAETVTGTFALLRPNRFIWHYDPPNELMWIADGELLWEYDVELEQATRGPLDFDETPALLLSGAATVSDRYDAMLVSSLDGEQLIELVPIDDAGEFGAVEIAFRDNIPRSIEYVDPIGRTHHIEFGAADVNTGLDTDHFEFDAPRGVDVIDVQ